MKGGERWSSAWRIFWFEFPWKMKHSSIVKSGCPERLVCLSSPASLSKSSFEHSCPTGQECELKLRCSSLRQGVLTRFGGKVLPSPAPAFNRANPSRYSFCLAAGDCEMRKSRNAGTPASIAPGLPPIGGRIAAANRSSAATARLRAQPTGPCRVWRIRLSLELSAVVAQPPRRRCQNGLNPAGGVSSGSTYHSFQASGEYILIACDCFPPRRH